jgi:hypothetical protein
MRRSTAPRSATGVHLTVSVVGLAAFGASLLAGAWFYVIVLGRAPATGPAWAIPADIALFTGFAAHHSVMARTGAKAWLTRLVPVHLERSVYVWTASLLFVAVCWLWLPIPGVAWRVEGLARLAVHSVQAVGLAITLASARLLDVFDLGGVRQVLAARRGSVVRPHVAEGTITRRGPFGWVRHPIYLGWLLMTLPAPTMTAGRLVFALVSSLYLLVAIPWEERSLAAEHGQAYRDYQRLVPWRVVPWVY